MLIRSLIVLKGMLKRNIRENNSSDLITAKMTQVFFKALTDYLNDKLSENDIFKYCDVHFFGADRYNIVGLKDHCEDKLFQEVVLNDEVFNHLRNFELYQLINLRRYCLSLLFPFEKIYDSKSDNISPVLVGASHEMVIDSF